MTCMGPFKINFDDLEWQSPVPGARFKSYVAQGKQLRLLELSSEFIELDWCEQAHVGFVLEGDLEINFRTQVIHFRQGDGLFIPPGCAHKARSLTSTVRLMLVEDV